MKVFISYAHVDRDRMLAIAEAIRSAGHEVEADVDILRGGDDFARRIEGSIAACDACVVLWSPSSAGKPWVPAEANLALQKGKRVISVKLTECSIPLPFSTFHMLDLTGSSDLGPLLASLAPPGTKVPPAPPPRSPWPLRLILAAMSVAVLSVVAWLAIPALRTSPRELQSDIRDAGPITQDSPPVTPPAPAVPDAGPPPAPTPDAGQAPVARPVRPKPPPGDPCQALARSYERVRTNCLNPCDLDHYPMREDLTLCRECALARAELERCQGSSAR